jgi:hypothetical protein
MVTVRLTLGVKPSSAVLTNSFRKSTVLPAQLKKPVS